MFSSSFRITLSDMVLWIPFCKAILRQSFLFAWITGLLIAMFLLANDRAFGTVFWSGVAGFILAFILHPVVHSIGYMAAYWNLSDENKDISVEIGPYGIKSLDRAGNVSVAPWSQIGSFYKTPIGFIYVRKPSANCAIPKRAFSDAESDKILRLANQYLDG